MIFADKSKSMDGINFDTVKSSLKDMANELFSEENKLFTSILLIFFNDKIDKEKSVNSKTELENFVDEMKAESATSFIECFKKIENIVKTAEKNSDY